MKDKLTNKRIKVDYQLIIRVLNLDLDFLEYQFKTNNKISTNRQALAFLTRKLGKARIEEAWNDCLAHGYTCFLDYQKEQERIAKVNIWEND